jgi:HEAT repeat protein
LLADELLQTAALETLGRLGGEEAVTPVADLLNASAVPVTTAARALAALYERQESLYHNGASVMASAHKAITSRGVQNLLNALEKSDGADLRMLAQVLGWLENPELDQVLTQLLGRSAARGVTVDALVRRGPRVTEWLLALLSAADQDTRRAAVLTLGRLGTAQAVPALLTALSSDEEIAIDVAGALAMIGDRRAYAPLLDLLGHADVGVRRAAGSALNSLGHPDMASDMATFLRDPRPLVRESAVKIAGYVGYSECVGLLLECCTDEVNNVRRAAVESLACLESVSVLPALRRALQDEATPVRIAAVRALGEVTDQGALTLLLGALEDAAPWVRYHAARSLGRQQDAGALHTLIRLAQTDEAMQVRVAAVEALGRIGGAVALPVLISLTDAPDSDLARAALSALAASSYPETWTPLLTALHSPDRTRRLDAIKVLGDSGRAEAISEFQRIAVGSDNELATAAVEALSHSSAPEAVDVLIEIALLPARRDAGVVALVRCGATRTGRLAAGLGHEHLDVRRAVVESLARIKNPKALEALRAALEDAEGAVRLAAFTALVHGGDSQEIPRLAALAETDSDPAVRWAAKSTLRR